MRGPCCTHSGYALPVATRNGFVDIFPRHLSPKNVGFTF